MPKESPTQQKIVGEVMHEFKAGKLESGRSHRRVKNRKQAVAIALSEAGASKNKSKAQNKRALKHTKAKKAAGRKSATKSASRAAKRR